MKTGNSYKRLQNTSRFISLILRHRPEAVGITIDEHGWADVREMIDGVNKSGKHTLDMEMLEEIVRTDEKQRYSFNEDHTLIRANQGHSIPVDVEPEEKIPPDILWHGTGEKYVSSIDAQGLIPKGRLYVHLSADMETARKVGRRHGKPVIYEIDCRGMAGDGYRFFLSANKVWLTKEVPARYLKKLDKVDLSGEDPRFYKRGIGQYPARLSGGFQSPTEINASGGSQPRKEEGASHHARRGKNAETFLNKEEPQTDF